MVAICGECEDYLYLPFAGLLRYDIKNGILGNDPIGSIGICRSHVDNLKLHSLEELVDGPVIMIDECTCESYYGDGRVPIGVEKHQTKILGYLTIEEAKMHLPNSLQNCPNLVKSTY